MGEIKQQLERICITLHHLDKHTEGIKVAVEKLNQWSIDHEERIRQLEKWQGGGQSFFTGVIFLMGVISSAVVGHIVK